ncbi:hypothetical protein [Ralstonia pseudosolanacearum]|uniref:hypothetical protein n=1 Tax=Ralstonia pseudosolanacearum TaxID=1310165 RepID=UPI0020C7A94A|nr:hypothetical protein [Ralstonia pseudosolanacearum]
MHRQRRRLAAGDRPPHAQHDTDIVLATGITIAYCNDKDAASHAGSTDRTICHMKRTRMRSGCWHDTTPIAWPTRQSGNGASAS